VSLSELREDLKRNMGEATGLKTVEQIREHLVNTLWPFIEANLDVIDEIDDAVAELVDQQEDYLQPETAAIFAAVVQSSMQLAAELQKRAGGDPLLAQLITNHEQLCEQAVMVLGQVTMISEDDEDGGNDEAQADATDDDGGNHE
jgi:hypothetical protein